MKSNLRFCAALQSELLNTNLNAKCSEYKLQDKLNSFSVSIKIIVQILYLRWIKKNLKFWTNMRKFYSSYIHKQKLRDFF
jgi:hypothetical protein